MRTGRFDTSHDVSEPFQGLSASLATYFDIVSLSMRRRCRITRRKTDDEQAVLSKLGGLGQCLGKRELGLEASSRKVTFGVKLPGIGHPFIDENQGWPELVEKFSKFVAWARRSFIVSANLVVGGSSSELIGKLTP